MNRDKLAPPQYKKELFIFKEFLDGMRNLCDQY